MLNGGKIIADMERDKAMERIGDQKWQPIETAPKGTLLLYYPAVTVGAYSQIKLPEMIRVDTANSTPNRIPTHWMPLPAPPQR